MKLDRTTYNRKRRQFKELELMGVSDIAKLLGWAPAKVTTYIDRGKLPEPIGTVGGRPVWLKMQFDNYVPGGGNE